MWEYIIGFLIIFLPGMCIRHFIRRREYIKELARRHRRLEEENFNSGIMVTQTTAPNLGDTVEIREIENFSSITISGVMAGLDDKPKVTAADGIVLIKNEDGTMRAELAPPEPPDEFTENRSRLDVVE